MPPKKNNKKNKKESAFNSDDEAPPLNLSAPVPPSDDDEDWSGKMAQNKKKKGGKRNTPKQTELESEPVEQEVQNEEEEITVSSFGKKGKKGGAKEKPSRSVQRDVEDDVKSEEEEEVEEERKEVSKKKNKKGTKVSQDQDAEELRKGGDDDNEKVDFGKKKKKNKGSPKVAVPEVLEVDSEEEPIRESKQKKKGSQVANAFALLNADENEEEESEENDVQEVRTGFAALQTGDEEEEEEKGDEQEQGEEEEEEQKKEEEEEEVEVEIKGRKKRDPKRKKKKAKEVAPETDDEETREKEAARFGNSGFERSQAAAYSYASGQPLGPDGTNPADAIAVTGNLISPPNSRDLQVDKLTIQAFGKLLIKDSELNLINGRRYGLIAPNGSGKSTLLHAIACGLVPIPRSLDVYLLDREFGPTEMTSIEAVLEIITREREHLEDEMTDLLSDVEKHAVRIDTIQARLTELEADGADRRAMEILKGLGFTDALVQTKTKDLSGGWRMRISLARILFVKPTLLMLDEPTNHLDLEAVVWLEEYLIHNLEGHTIIITSHSQDTLNEVCTDIVHLYHNHLDYYSGNYDTFVKVRAEKDSLLKKRARAQNKQMAKIKESLGKTGSKQQQQAKAKVKAMEKRDEKEKEKDKTLQEEIIQEKELNIRFEQCNGGIPSPALKFRDVTFAYPDQPNLFEELDFGIDLDSRIALVGPNGAGKSTLIKLMLNQIEATQGEVARHHHLRLAHFHQHMGDQLDLNLSAVHWLRTQFSGRNDHEMRQLVGRFGLTGKQQVIPMRQLSDGQRRRVIFAYLGLRNPHIILMDEPTNALDLDTIDALAEAINDFDGGVVFVTHDFRLIDQVAEEIWIVNDGTVEVFDGSIHDYKKMLKDRIRAEREAAEAGKL